MVPYLPIPIMGNIANFAPFKKHKTTRKIIELFNIIALCTFLKYIY